VYFVLYFYPLPWYIIILCFLFAQYEVDMSSLPENNRVSIICDLDVPEETEEECDCVKSLPYADWILKKPDGTRCPVPSTEIVDGVNTALSCLFEATSVKLRHRKSGKSTPRHWPSKSWDEISLLIYVPAPNSFIPEQRWIRKCVIIK